ncbi:hypothetical protein [Dietzia sp. SYD-A1]|uniref:hypothetical protein n=1 Tax=Dietzia sp. SYD-A1 TaxID=2780141 RepID=UPI001890FC56|nr:hypothetical protein [Dietzia sp. SYD-A1]
MGKYIAETLEALSSRGVRTLVALSFVIAGIYLGNGGVATAAAVLLTSLGCGMTVLIIKARASIDSDRE